MDTNSALFKDVQIKAIFEDSKTFCDAQAQQDWGTINTLYLNEKNYPDFDLKSFVYRYFIVPEPILSPLVDSSEIDLKTHTERLWKILERNPKALENHSLIPLPQPYIVPGGRFREIYYWDSYFTLLGVAASENWTMVENMIKNFAHLIQQFGFIPNGNRTYYLSRSQPPYFALMVDLLAKKKGEAVIVEYLPFVEKEYSFWMAGSSTVSAKNPDYQHLVWLSDNALLNRYWDAEPNPRPESYREDIELAKDSLQDKADIYRHIRAAAASGWDFSTRWFSEENDFSTIQTTDILPVDLNCLLYYYEIFLAKGFLLEKNSAKNLLYTAASESRKAAIQRYFWDDKQKAYTDYNWKKKQTTTALSLAMVYPLFVKIAEPAQAQHIARMVDFKFLKPNGLITTLQHSLQQWDAPNGWAPLHWVSIIALENYGYESLAKNIAERWLKLNEKIFKQTGKMMEKYNVEDSRLEAGGGEYPGQDGFGWTNGVYLALLKKYSNTQ